MFIALSGLDPKQSGCEETDWYRPVSRVSEIEVVCFLLWLVGCFPFQALKG